MPFVFQVLLRFIKKKCITKLLYRITQIKCIYLKKFTINVLTYYEKQRDNAHD